MTHTAFEEGLGRKHTDRRERGVEESTQAKEGFAQDPHHTREG